MGGQAALGQAQGSDQRYQSRFCDRGRLLPVRAGVRLQPEREARRSEG